MSDPVTYRREANVSILQFDDGKANVFNPDMMRAINASLDEAEADSTRAVILLGNDRMFSGGIDLKTLPRLSGEDRLKFLNDYAQGMARLFLFGKPTIAASTGHALAGGAVMLMTADIRIGTEGDFKVGLNETQIALTLPSFVLVIAESAINPLFQPQVILHGKVHTPQQALESGLYQRLVSKDRLLETALESARALAPVDLSAYHESKLRLRDKRMQVALAMMESEINQGFTPKP